MFKGCMLVASGEFQSTTVKEFEALRKLAARGGGHRDVRGIESSQCRRLASVA